MDRPSYLVTRPVTHTPDTGGAIGNRQRRPDIIDALVEDGCLRAQVGSHAAGESELMRLERSPGVDQASSLHDLVGGRAGDVLEITHDVLRRSGRQRAR